MERKKKKKEERREKSKVGFKIKLFFFLVLDAVLKNMSSKSRSRSCASSRRQKRVASISRMEYKEEEEDTREENEKLDHFQQVYEEESKRFVEEKGQVDFGPYKRMASCVEFWKNPEEDVFFLAVINKFIVGEYEIKALLNNMKEIIVAVLNKHPLYVEKYSEMKLKLDLEHLFSKWNTFKMAFSLYTDELNKLAETYEDPDLSFESIFELMKNVFTHFFGNGTFQTYVKELYQQSSSFRNECIQELGMTSKLFEKYDKAMERIFNFSRLVQFSEEMIQMADLSSCNKSVAKSLFVLNKACSQHAGALVRSLSQ